MSQEDIPINSDIPIELMSPREAFARLTCAEMIVSSLPYSQHASVAALLALGLGFGDEAPTLEDITEAVRERRSALEALWKDGEGES